MKSTHPSFLSRRLWAAFSADGAAASIQGRLHIGVERLVRGTAYHWDGLHRGASADRPFVCFQYTLDGWGCFQSQGRVQRVGPGSAFTAIIPSEHRYYLPAEAPNWEFFWLILHHPYLVQRLRRWRSTGEAMPIAPNSALAAAAARLLEGVCRGTLADELDLEQAMLEFMIAHERHARNLEYPDAPRLRLLREVGALVNRRLDAPPGIEALAQHYEMSRSGFSHHFKAVTGQSPSDYILELRLEEVRRRLRHGRDKLQSIARATGFADANHLCKVFRRVHHLSPGTYRRQWQRS